MATTQVNFVRISTTVSGSAATIVVPSAPNWVNVLGSAVDRFSVDLSAAGYAKNGSILLALAASTPVTIDLTSFATNSTSQAGDTSFATVFEVIFNNFGSHDVTVIPGASNGFNGPLSGTSPVFTIAANSSMRWQSVAGWTVSGSVKTLTFESSSTASLAVSVGGA